MLPSVNVFNKNISMYNIATVLGIIVCLFYIIKICKKRNINDNDVIIVLLIGLIGVFIGGHLLYALTRFDLIKMFISKIDRVKSFNVLIKCLYEIFGGAVFYGGLIGGLISSYAYIKRKKLNLIEISDICTPVIPLFHFFGRIGCFLSGCCYGIESKIGFVYKYSVVELANGVKRFPIQLVEASYNLLLFLFFYYLYKNNKIKGKLIFIYLILYSIARFIFEFFRGDFYRGFLFGLSTSQIISILLLCFSIICLIKNNYKKSR